MRLFETFRHVREQYKQQKDLLGRLDAAVQQGHIPHEDYKKARSALLGSAKSIQEALDHANWLLAPDRAYATEAEARRALRGDPMRPNPLDQMWF